MTVTLSYDAYNKLYKIYVDYVFIAGTQNKDEAIDIFLLHKHRAESRVEATKKIYDELKDLEIDISEGK